MDGSVCAATVTLVTMLSHVRLCSSVNLTTGAVNRTERSLPILAEFKKDHRLTFKLEDNDQLCFYQEIDKGETAKLDYQVIEGGNFDIDVVLHGPRRQNVYREYRKESDSFQWQARLQGIYRLCFSNEFSTFAHKTVFFRWSLLNDPQTNPPATLMDTATVHIFRSLNMIMQYQNYFLLSGIKGRSYSEFLNEQVFYWSLGEMMVIVLIGLVQICVLRGFFTNSGRTIPL